MGKDAEGAVFALFIPGDHELNEIKAERVVNGFTLLTDEELEAAGLHKTPSARRAFLKASRLSAM